MRPLAKTLALAAAACASASLVAAAPAAADSIAYIRAGNVWLATPDGSRQVQVTARGGYSYVSQADDGTMIALAPGERLHRLSRNGEVLSDFPTYVSDGAPQSGPVNKFHGPFEPEISPDGKLVAFEWFNDNYDNGSTPDCNPSNGCYDYSARQGVGITYADRFTGYEQFGLLTGWIYPSWLSSDTLLRSWANTTLNDDTVINRIAPGAGDDNLDHWFYDPTAAQTVANVELSRDGNAVVGILGSNEDTLRVYRPTMDPMGAPDWNHTPFAQGNQPVVEPCYEYTGPIGGKFHSVTIAPDSKHIAYGVGNGIWVSDVPDLSGGCTLPAGNALRIPDGSFPDWGPADVPATSPVAGGSAGSGGSGSGGTGAGSGGSGSGSAGSGSGPGGVAAPTPVLAAKPARVTLARALRSGLRVTVTGATSGRVTVTAFEGSKRVGTGSAPTGSRVIVKFTRSARRTLARRRAVRLKLAVLVTPAGGATSATVTLRR